MVYYYYRMARCASVVIILAAMANQQAVFWNVLVTYHNPVEERHLITFTLSTVSLHFHTNCRLYLTLPIRMDLIIPEVQADHNVSDACSVLFLLQAHRHSGFVASQTIMAVTNTAQPSAPIMTLEWTTKLVKNHVLTSVSSVRIRAISKAAA